MSDINYKLDYLSETKQRIKKAIINKGVEVSNTDTFRSYADKINNISGGSSADIVEAIVDSSALPIESGKKVVVANIQATGQGAGAIMPFDVSPYATNYQAVTHLLQLKDEYPLHINTQGTIPAHIGYKKVGDKWEGKYFANKFTGVTNPNDAFNLLYDKSSFTYFLGSDGSYWNPISAAVETIEFDVPFTSSLLTNISSRYFLTHDSKYLWAVHLNASGSNQASATSGLICLYEIRIDDVTGKVSAYKKTDEVEITMQPSHYQCGTCSLNHHGIVIWGYGYSANTTYVQFDETTGTLTHETKDNFWAGSSRFGFIAFTKTWVLLRYSSSYRVYWGDVFSAPWVGGDFGTAATEGTLARYGNTFYPLPVSYDGVGSDGILRFLKMPVDKEQPVPDDFIIHTISCYSTDAGPYMIDEENCIMGSTYASDCSQALRFYNIVNNQRAESDPSRVPTMLLDDGTGYFFANNKTIINGASLEVIAPVNGSYTNGTLLHTITSTRPYPSQMLQPEGAYSSTDGKNTRFGTLPAYYIDNGAGCIFQTYYYNAGYEGGTNRAWYFYQADKDPLEITWGNYARLVIGQNKAYLTPYSNTRKTLTVISAGVLKDYTAISTAYNQQGVHFEFEGSLYSYKISATSRGSYIADGDWCCQIALDDEALTATYSEIPVDVSEINQMASYITGYTLHPSSPYPIDGYVSMYNQPVLTKDNKYFVGLIGNHTTHYAKIEKHSSGYPALNVYEFPDTLKNLLYAQEILYFEAYYPSGFGIQLANGTFLLCEYEQGIDVDLKITTYTPAHSYTFTSWQQCIMHFTSHKNYWYFSAETYINGSQRAGYAGCGRREDLPSTYQTKVFSMKHSFAGTDHVTGYLTGTYKEDENKNIIAEVKTLLG